MTNRFEFSSKFMKIVISVLVTALLVVIVFYGYRPINYDLSVGSICSKDIYANRNFIDSYQTEYDANIAKNSVEPIFIRSEDLSVENLERIDTFFILVLQARSSLIDEDGFPIEDISPVINDLMGNLQSIIGSSPEEDTLLSLLTMSTSGFNLVHSKAVSITEIIMMDNVNMDSLSSAIDREIESFNSTSPNYQIYSPSLSSSLKTILKPNSVFDENLTKEAGESLYHQVINDPIIIEKGTKLVSAGEVVDLHSYQKLVDLELIRGDSFDFIILARVASYIMLLMVASIIYIINCGNDKFKSLKMIYTLVITAFVPVALSVYLSDFSTILAISLFFTTIVATYLGVSSGIILSSLIILIMWPLYSFEVEYLVVNIIGALVCSVLAGNKKKLNSALIIITPTVFCILTALVYSFLNGDTTSGLTSSAIWAGSSSILSIVIAIGFMPIYEIIFSSVSPVKLIDLSSPGKNLQKRLFIEAPGTYHHSLMVSNLADSAAEAIGADALLCKVAAYYHDIGKLTAPLFFTENQSDGINPHDNISTMESVDIIRNHIRDGVKLGRENHLPEALIKIIDEHHGTTVPSFFYIKACKEAEAQGQPKPDEKDFTYKGHIPSSKESAIIMIADTCEAAIRALKLTDLDEIEKIIRNLIKAKIEKDQLINSKLSFEDLENIIKAFRQVYQGSMHERIKYPDAN